MKWNISFLSMTNDKISEQIYKYLRKNTLTLLDDSKEVGLECNTEKTKHMFMFLNHTA